MIVKNPRKYGNKPFGLALVHGGPGAAGEMAVPARILSSGRGVLEPMQTKMTVGAQAEELRGILEKHADPPTILIGFSWGAWLGFITAAHYPGLIRKLILVSSGPFCEKDARNIIDSRLNRLSPEQREETMAIMDELSKPFARDKDKLFSRLGHLISLADACDPLDSEPVDLDVRFDIHRAVWPEADQMRRSGKLLNLASRIRCPVVALHGDCDPHPARGVEVPLSEKVPDFRFILIRNCGHRPWIERQARDYFFKVLEEEIETADPAGISVDLFPLF